MGRVRQVIVKQKVKRSPAAYVIKPKRRVASRKPRTLLGQALRSAGGFGGTALGGIVGMPATGGALGSSLGAALSKWLGSGDYEVTSNSVLGKTSPEIPFMHTDGQTVTIRHKEFIGTVTGSTGFTVNHALILNPGMSATFPWLSRIANSFQQYVVKGAVFHYIPTSGNAINSTNPAIGSVMIQTTYRSNDSSPLSKTEMLNEYWASEGPPNETLAHPIECNPSENPFRVQYIRSTGTGTESPLMYDLGKTFIATSGMPAAHPVGDLWLTYEIELRKPIVRSDIAPAVGSALGVVNTVTLPTMFTGIEWEGLAIVSAGHTITFPRGLHGTFAYSLVLELVSGGNFTDGDLSGDATTVNCQENEYDRTVIGSATTTGKLFRVGLITIADAAQTATFTLPTMSAVPDTDLITKFRFTPYS